jgi:hypothetical protein
MADELSKREPLDLQKINLSERLELRWWCAQLGCTEEQLREAHYAPSGHLQRR